MKPHETCLLGGSRTRRSRIFTAALLALFAGAATVWLPSASGAPPPPHGVTAASINVVEVDFANTAASVIVTPVNPIGDFRIRPTANRGDYDMQIGDDYTDDAPNGIVMTCVAMNGRESIDINGNPDPVMPGINYCTTAIQSQTAGSYYIPVFQAPSGDEYNINVAAAYFPYATWLGGYAQNSANGGALTTFRGSPGLVLGTHFVDLGGGKSTVDLTSLGINSQTDGVLLVTGGKNEDNYSLSTANTNGTWTIFNKDNGTSGTSTEQDPVAFVFIPKTNTMVISGKFLGDGTIAMFSGSSPQFAVTNTGEGQYRLTIPGWSPKTGVLIISAEGGVNLNADNIVSYQPNGDGWDIETRDLATAPLPLETPGTEPVLSFAFILGSTPGFTVTPTSGLFTTEYGDTAQFSVVLDTQPTADVTVNLASDDTGEGIAAPTSLTFTTNDWNVPQFVTITGQDDALIDGAVAYTIVLSPATSADADYNGLNPADVSVLNADNDAGGITVNPTSGLTTTEAGGTATFTVRLNTAPTANVTIGLSSSDTTEGTVSPASLTFTSGDWNVDQTVTVTGVDDFVDEGDIAYTIITAPAASADPLYTGQNAANVSVTNLDNDTSGLVLAPTALSVVEGSTANFTVALATQPTANVDVGIVSGDTTQGGSVAPATLTFTPANWSTPQSVTVTGVNDLVPDGDVAYFITNTVTSSGDPLYLALAPAVLATTTLDNEAALTLPSGLAIYGTGMPGVGIDGRAMIVDPNTPNYNTATLTVVLTANGTADDRLEIRNTGTAAGEIGVSGTSVTYGGVTIGTFAGGVGTTPLVVTLNASATPEAAQALLRNVTFRNVSTNQSLTSRAVAVTLADADGGISSASTSIRVGLVRLAEFQEAADHGYGVYTGAADIELRETNPDTPYPSGHGVGNTMLFIDTVPITEHCQALLRFDNIVGDGPGQIPTNSIIVSAELMLYIDPTYADSRGDGSPLYRMLVPWSADFDTWNFWGSGIQTDDVEAKSTYDSQFGLSNGDANCDYGSISLGVTPDVQAWVSGGEANYGWALPGWEGNGDGTAVTPCEAAKIDNRPRLRVMWVPAGTLTASFRQGVNGYTTAYDTRIRENASTNEFSTVTGVFSDWAVTNAPWGDNEQVLLRFDDIIGTGAGQIPQNAQIHAAMLDLASVIGNAMGDGGKFHAMLQPWQDTNTWDSLVNGISADGVEAAVAPTTVAGNASLAPNVQGAFLSFELTSDVQAWAYDLRPNYGWVVLPWPGGGDGWGFGTAEQATERNRPALRVFYSPGSPPLRLLKPVHNGSNVQLTFTGTESTTYSIQRVGALGGTWGTIGTATTSGTGTGTFTDNAPLPNAAFYRVVYP